MSAMRVICGAAALSMLSLPAFAEPTKLEQQSQCTTTGLCAFFNGATTFPTTIRSIGLRIPGPGRVQWTFIGSAQCLNSNRDSTPNSGVIDITTDITLTGATAPDIANPSANRYAFRLPPTSSTSAVYSIPISFYATRTATYLTGGVKGAFFRISANRMDILTACTVLTGSFSTVYTPD